MMRLLITIQHKEDTSLISMSQFVRLVRKLTQFNIHIIFTLTSLLLSRTFGTMCGKHRATMRTAFSSALDNLQTLKKTPK